MHTGDPVGVGRMIWPHGRWRVELRGEANHAGTTPLADRRDPMLALAAFIAHVRRAATTPACSRPSASCASTRTASTRSRRWSRPGWTSAREDESAVEAVLAPWDTPRPRSWTPITLLDAGLADVIADALDDPPRLGTGAGHDAGILAAAGIPTAMLFVRNPSGISHAPAEDAEEADCLAGIDALVACWNGCW